MPLPPITEDEYNELKLRQMAEAESRRSRLTYRPPDFSALEQQLPGAVSSASSAVSSAVSSASSAPPVSQVAPAFGTPQRSPEQLMALGQSQFDQSNVTYSEALAACGPAAALAFAAANGRPPSLREAIDLAKVTGWTEGGGQAGPAAQQKLLTALGVPSRLEAGVDWGSVQRDVAGGNPVMLSSSGGPGLQGSAGHYWQILGYRPEDDRYFVGPSGTAYRGGKEWMSPAEIAAVAGKPTHALYLDNPYTPTPSVAVQGEGQPLGLIDRSSPQAFLASAAPYAAQVEAESGIPASIMLGIAANETGYGKFSSGNNFFGIKGRNPQTGASFNSPTWEVEGGKRVNTTDTFRAYDSPADSFRDFAAFLRDNPRYGAALQVKDNPTAFIRAVHQAGYATDPNWSNQVLSIASGAPTATLPTTAPLPSTRGQGVPDYAALEQQTQEQAAAFAGYRPPPRAPLPTYQPPLRNIGATAYGLQNDPVLGQSSYDQPYTGPSTLDQFPAGASPEGLYSSQIPQAGGLPAAGPMGPQGASTPSPGVYQYQPPEAPAPEMPSQGPPAPEGWPTEVSLVTPEQRMQQQIAAAQGPFGQTPPPAAPYEEPPSFSYLPPAPPPTPAPPAPLAQAAQAAVASGPAQAALGAIGTYTQGPRDWAGEQAGRTLEWAGQGNKPAPVQTGLDVAQRAGELARDIVPSSIVTRTLAGEEQIANESRPEWDAMKLAIQQYGADSPQAEAAAATYNAKAAALRAEGVYNVAERNPSLMPAEIGTGLAFGATTGAAAPGLANSLLGGLVLDPYGIAGVGGLARGAGAIGRRLGGIGAREAAEEAARVARLREAPPGIAATRLAEEAARLNPPRHPEWGIQDLPPLPPAENPAYQAPRADLSPLRGVARGVMQGAVAGAVATQVNAIYGGEEPTVQDYLRNIALAGITGGALSRFGQPVLRVGERILGSGPARRPEPPEGFAKSGELIQTTYETKPNREFFERQAQLYPDQVFYDPGEQGWFIGGKVPKTTGEVPGIPAGMRTPLTGVELNPRLPLHLLKNEKMNAFLTRVFQNKQKVASGEMTPEAMVLSHLSTVLSVGRGSNPLVNALQGAFSSENLLRLGTDYQMVGGLAYGQAKGAVIRPEMVAGAIAGDTTDPVMMKMLAAIARPDSFGSAEERHAAMTEGVMELYRRANIAGHGPKKDPQGILGIEWFDKNGKRSQSIPWTETEPALWADVQRWARSEGTWGSMDPAANRAAFQEMSLAGSPHLIGKTKSNFWPAMLLNPDLATLDSRMLNDVFGLAKNINLNKTEYNYLIEKVHTAVGHEFRYGSQWLPWEFVGGEETTYNALADIYDNVSGFMHKAEALAQERGVPLGHVIDELSAAEPKLPVTPGSTRVGQSRIGIAGEVLQGIRPGMGITEIETVAPEVASLIKQAGVKVVGKVRVGHGYWVDDAGQAVSERDLDLVVKGTESQVEWLAASLGQILKQANGDPQDAVLVSHLNAGTDPVASLVVSAKNLDLITAIGEKLRAELGGWHIGVSSPGNTSEVRVFMAGLDADGFPVDHVQFQQQIAAIRAELLASGLKVRPPAIDLTTSTRFIPVGEYDEIIRGGPEGYRVRGAGQSAGSTVPGGPQLATPGGLPNQPGPGGLPDTGGLRLGQTPSGAGPDAAPGAPGAQPGTRALGAALGASAASTEEDQEGRPPGTLLAGAALGALGAPAAARRARPFYSAMRKALEEKLPANATIMQIRDIVTKAAKADEIKWSGIDDYLASQGDKPIAREPLLKWLDENQVQVEEVLKGGDDYQASTAALNAREAHYAAVNAFHVQARQEGNTLAQSGDLMIQGRNHPENLSPALQRLFPEVQRTQDEFRRLSQEAEAVRPRYADEEYNLPGGEDYQELLLTMPGPSRVMSLDEYIDLYPKGRSGEHSPGTLERIRADYQRLRAAKDPQVMTRDVEDYDSPHWPGEPNVLAHVRFNDRTDAAGKRTLFLEEIQSDWHQEGRKKGYGPEGRKFLAMHSKNVGDWDIHTPPNREGETVGAFMGSVKADTPEEALAKFRAKVKAEGSAYLLKGLPEGPFQKTWHELAFRRMAQYAAEHGYDQIAWTTGAQQAARWAGDEVDRSKGMAGFYDEMLPAYAEKFGKKWGTRVQDTTINAPGDDDMVGDFPYHMEQEPMGHWAIYDDNDIGGPPNAVFNTQAEAQAALDSVAKQYGIQTVHALPLTDQMRASITGEGQPLFNVAPPIGAAASQSGTDEETPTTERVARGAAGLGAGFLGARFGRGGARAAAGAARTASGAPPPTQDIADAREAFRIANAEMAKAGKKGLPQEELANLAEAVTRWRAQVEGPKSDPARILRSMDRHPELASDPAARGRALLSSVYKNHKEEDFAQFMNEIDMGDPVAIARAVKTLGQKSLRDYGGWAWFNGMLSNPVGRIADFVSTGLATGMYPLEKAAAIPFDMAMSLKTGKRTILAGEVPAEYVGMRAALQNSTRNAGEILRHGFSAEEARADLGVAAREPVQGPLGGFPANAPSRIIRANDAFYGGQNAEATIYADAYRTAKQEGLKGEALQARYQELQDHPTDEMVAHAEAVRQERLWQKPNPLTEWLGGARKIPILSETQLPFTMTPVNLAKYALDRSPLGVASLGIALKKGDQKGVAEAAARTGMGSAVVYGMYKLAEQDLITGDMPKDAAERDEWARVGKQPYSFRVGDNWYSYQKAPWAPLMAAGPAAVEAQRHAQAGDEWGILLAAVLAAGKSMSDLPMMQSLGQTLNALENPERFGESWVEGQARSVVPQFVQAISRASDQELRNPEGPWEALLSVLPGANTLVPGRQTAFGESNLRPEGQRGLGALNPLRPSAAKGNLVETELAKLHLPSEGYRVQPGVVYRDITVGKENVDLTREESAAYQKAAGQMAFAKLYAAMTTDDWKNATPEEQRKFVHNTYAKAREDARKIVIPQLQQRAREQQQQRQQRMAG